MMEVYKLSGRLSDMTKEQRIHHYQIINQHIEVLLMDPKPAVDYSSMSMNELAEHCEFINEREAYLREIIPIEVSYFQWGERYFDFTGFFEFKKEIYSSVIYNYDFACTYVKDAVTGFFKSMKNMIWKTEKEKAVEKNTIFFVC
ncbi:hypothetical protein B9Z55_011806 [Caenorhabditis nigoni]|uniref:Uncharacterized protein n=2 Tax=Caenorhabditis nigoni TaxID=1611254 RepID=A0A2G5ULS1_9PELO|nr:hypothetical protein B9Z55_011806 [Caenorhabditis nigoni]